MPEGEARVYIYCTLHKPRVIVLLLLWFFNAKIAKLSFVISPCRERSGFLQPFSGAKGKNKSRSADICIHTVNNKSLGSVQPINYCQRRPSEGGCIHRAAVYATIILYYTYIYTYTDKQLKLVKINHQRGEIGPWWWWNGEVGWKMENVHYRVFKFFLFLMKNLMPDGDDDYDYYYGIYKI